ncbi:MAG: epoxyqueuosine reductase QueH [Bacillota bacterium]
MKLLLHACCGPCAIVPVKNLQDKEFDFSVLYFNPNIHPLAEHVRRGEGLKTLSKSEGFELIYSTEYAQCDWENFLGESPNRCKLCYEMRIEETARQAKLRGFDAFSTTLLISPYQNHKLIKKIGEEIGEEFGIKFYYEDFRPEFREGQALAKAKALYRQKYCGCVNSLAESGK